MVFYMVICFNGTSCPSTPVAMEPGGSVTFDNCCVCPVRRCATVATFANWLPNLTSGRLGAVLTVHVGYKRRPARRRQNTALGLPQTPSGPVPSRPALQPLLCIRPTGHAQPTHGRTPSSETRATLAGISRIIGRRPMCYSQRILPKSRLCTSPQF